MPMEIMNYISCLSVDFVVLKFPLTMVLGIFRKTSYEMYFMPWYLMPK